jgi:outer membrane protein OmpA-like peptidoglycan-associated protein
MTLSENRAKSVFDYLVNAGIEASRLSFKGYGDSQPVADNNKEEGRAMNRRTEFKVIL